MEMQREQPTVKGPAETFTGDVWFDVIAGAAIGPLLASATLASAGDNPRAVFWLAPVPGIASGLIGWWLLRDRPVPPKDAGAPRPGFRDLGRAFALFTAISTLFSLGNSSDALLVLRAQNLGMAMAITGDVTAKDNPPDESAGRGPLRTVGPAQSDRRRW